MAPEAQVFADHDMVKLIFRNLISNALKFTSKDGQIVVSAYETPEAVEFWVSDTGIGIAPDVLEKLFQIEYHVSTRGTAKEVGTGLGLLLCKEFVEKNKGRIWAESENTQGAVFKVSLPKSGKTQVVKTPAMVS